MSKDALSALHYHLGMFRIDGTQAFPSVEALADPTGLEHGRQPDHALVALEDHSHPVANALVAITGVTYFLAWSLSFYPQVIHNYRRKKTTGLSADFIIVNPLGFLALTIWNWGMYFDPTARAQYKARHDGHLPQIAISDLAFSLHALILSSFTLGQVVYYAWRNGRKRVDGEGQPLLDAEAKDMPSTIKPSRLAGMALLAMGIATLVSVGLVWTGKAQLLDWLYFVSTLKLIITTVKYIPQAVLNYRLKSTKGLAIWVILLDLSGSVPSFAQLVISAVFVEHDPYGIIANPAKLGLSLLSVVFDLVFIVQNYWLYTGRRRGEDEQEE